MKTNSSFFAFALGTLLVSAASAADTPPPAARPAAPAAAASTPAPSRPAAVAPNSGGVISDQPSPVSPPEKFSAPLAENKATEKAIQQHIRPVDPSVMETPPPAPRAETRPDAPVAGMVWVPGHWTPAKGEWQWTSGIWGVPATPSSIWIPSKYEPKTKQWSAGYWQPDRPQPIEPQLPAKDVNTVPPGRAPY